MIRRILGTSDGTDSAINEQGGYAQAALWTRHEADCHVTYMLAACRSIEPSIKIVS